MRPVISTAPDREQLAWQQRRGLRYTIQFEPRPTFPATRHCNKATEAGRTMPDTTVKHKSTLQ